MIRKSVVAGGVMGVRSLEEGLSHKSTDTLEFSMDEKYGKNVHYI